MAVKGHTYQYTVIHDGDTQLVNGKYAKNSPAISLQAVLGHHQVKLDYPRSKYTSIVSGDIDSWSMNGMLLATGKCHHLHKWDPQ